MKVPYRWLLDYVETKDKPEELAEKLTMAGVEVEAIETFGEKISHLVAGKILSLRQHPKADKLQLVEVDTGKEKRNIVCGAWNIQIGDMVPVALPGCQLPGDFKVEKAEIRGEHSDGMICSAQELGLEIGSEEEILILPGNTLLGSDVNKVLLFGESILELALTPNRSDCLGLLGVAREVSALTGSPIKSLNCSLQESSSRVEDEVAVEIKESELCSRFTARLLANVEVNSSPLFMQLRLLQVGIRPINSVVDITNYVMWETGQPLHAYDYEKLSGGKIVARMSSPGEKIVTLDGVTRTLSPEMLVIADSSRGIGLAGVMGGEDTEITKETTKILLEAAHFHPVSIRKTSKYLGLPSEASQRFERGVNPEMALVAQDRAAYFMSRFAGASVYKGILDKYPKPLKPLFINLRAKKVSRVVGYDIPEKRIKDILFSLGFTVQKKEQGVWEVMVPPARNDVSLEEDLIEEIARLEGYHKIPSRLPQGVLTSGRLSERQRIVETIKNLLAGAGLAEIITFSFMDPQCFGKISIPEGHHFRNALFVSNPLSEDQKIMRTTLIANMLETLSYNFHRDNQQQRLFEIGTVFLPQSGLDLDKGILPKEKTSLCLAATGKWLASPWQKKEHHIDFFYLKGIIEEITRRLELPKVTFQKESIPFLHPGRSANININDRPAGFLGELLPAITEGLHGKNRIYLAELDLEHIIPLANLNTKFTPVPRYPAVLRDLALVVPEETTAEELSSAILKAGEPFVEDVHLFDVYEGEQIPVGYKSLAFAVTFRHSERTLTDEEVRKVQEHINLKLAEDHRASLRDF